MAPIIGKAKAAVDISIAYLTGIRHLFHRPYTLRFPQQRYAVEKGYRGRHLLHLDRCTGCGICAWICPEKCITIVPRGQRWYPQYFYGRCFSVTSARTIVQSLRWRRRWSTILQSIRVIVLFGVLR